MSVCWQARKLIDRTTDRPTDRPTDLHYEATVGTQPKTRAVQTRETINLLLEALGYSQSALTQNIEHLLTFFK